MKTEAFCQLAGHVSQSSSQDLCSSGPFVQEKYPRCFLFIFAKKKVVVLCLKNFRDLWGYLPHFVWTDTKQTYINKIPKHMSSSIEANLRSSTFFNYNTFVPGLWLQPGCQICHEDGRRHLRQRNQTLGEHRTT